MSVDSGKEDGGVEECKTDARTDEVAGYAHSIRSSASEDGRGDAQKQKSMVVVAGASILWRTRERNCCDFDFAR